MSGPILVSDCLVGIDSAATPGYLGAASSDGVLRTGVSMTYVDGGDYVTLGVVYSNPGGTLSEAFGDDADATADHATAFGNLATAGEDGVAVGHSSSADQECVAIGGESVATNVSGATYGSTAIGYLAMASNDNSLAVGNNTSAAGVSSLAFGSFSVVGASSSATAIGTGATIGDSCTSSVAMGPSVTIGDGSTNCLALGALSAVSGGADNVLAIGGSSAYSNCIVMGRGASSTAANQAVIGGTTCNITTLYVGKGITAVPPDATVTITVTGRSGANATGSHLNLQGGANTGTNTTGGCVKVSTGDVGSSGSTAQTAVERACWYINTGGGFVGNEGGFDYDHRWEGDTDANLFCLDASADCVGFSTNAPLVKADVNGGFALRSSGSATSLTADNQAVTVGNRSHIMLSSNDATATNRTFTLSNGLTDGQMLVLVWKGTNAGEIVAATNIKLSATWTPTQYDTLSLIWNTDAAAWLELTRSANA